MIVTKHTGWVCALRFKQNKTWVGYVNATAQFPASPAAFLSFYAMNQAKPYKWNAILPRHSRRAGWELEEFLGSRLWKLKSKI